MIGSEERAGEAMGEVYVQPGESYLARGPTILRTVLGSCVGVTFWNGRLGIGALCHTMLPRHPGTGRGTLTRAAARRYVDFAIQEMAEQMDALGARRPETQVKLFGGADVLLVRDHGARRPTVGKLNCEAAVRILEAEGFDVAVSRLGGTSGVHLDFDTATGEVWLRRLS
jgi:chemotaxis protein CheD